MKTDYDWSWSASLIASLSVSGADYPTSSPTKWDFKSERECPALVARYISHILANISNPKFPTTLPHQCQYPAELDYLVDADHQLANCFIYHPLSFNPTQTYNTELSSSITTASLS